MLGQILVRDYEKCVVNGYCKCGDGGVGTKVETKEEGYRVLERVGENIIKILFR